MVEGAAHAGPTGDLVLTQTQCGPCRRDKPGALHIAVEDGHAQHRSIAGDGLISASSARGLLGDQGDDGVSAQFQRLRNGHA